MKSRRIGKFYVSDKLFEDMSNGNGTNLFFNMIVLFAQSNPMTNKTMYIAHHPDFEPLEVGCEAPEYKPVFSEDTTSYGYAYGFPTWEKVK